MKRWETDKNTALMSIAPDIPADISDRLSRLRLLHGVPLSYLVSDESLLPPESVSFFYIDNNWTDALSDGALSIGRNSAKTAALDTAALPHFKTRSTANLHAPRLSAMHARHAEFSRLSNSVPGETLTGFIMRSALCRKWKGLETAAYGSNKRLLDILRMELLSDELLICIYNGELAEITVREPKEGLRFGTHGNDRTINVRKTDAGHEGDVTGKTIKLTANSAGHADIKQLAADINSALGGAVITSAEMAMELIVAPVYAEFKRDEEE
jgi:hypothetical protein